MKRLLSIATLLALAAAKPELYKETEDFQYARSSSDDGSKSGFYGAQRGNMGGNYERAHNMDGLAQNQMSGLVRQVEGELGDGSNMRTGSVFTSSNSRGIYGSGKYDLSNLQGRNFQEGATYGDSQSHSSLSSHHSSAISDHSSSALHSAGYRSQNMPYRNSANYHQHSSDLHTGEAYHSTGSMSSAGHNSGYHRQAVALQIPENQDQLQQASSLHGSAANAYNSNSYGYNHGSHVASSHDSRHMSQSGYHSQSEYDQSNLNQQTSDSYRSRPTGRLIVATPVRVYGRPGQRIAIPVAAQMYEGTHSASTVDQNAINSEAEVLNNADEHVDSSPTTNSKHYQSSYSYRKQWEKHSTNPEIVSVGIPTENPFSDKKSELYDISQANKEHHSTGLSSSAHTNIAHHANSKMESASSTNYQSAVDSQHSSSDVNSNTHRGYNLGNSEDSVNGFGSSDSRPRSYQSSYSYHKAWERQGDPYVIQPVSGTSADHESQRLTSASNRHSGHVFNSHGSEVDCDEDGYRRKARSVPTQFDTYKNIYDSSNDNGQQTQQQWGSLENIGQETQQFNKLEDLGQQTQHFDKIEDLGQQTQKKWDKLEDYEHQSNRWDGFEDLGQQTQNKWDNLQELGQQTQNNWDNLQELGQHTQNHWNFQEQEQQNQNKWGNLEDQQSQNNWDTLGQQTDQRWDKVHVGQNQQTDMGQQTQDSWNTMNLGDFGQQTQQSDRTWTGTGDLRKELDTSWDSPLDHTQQQINTDHKNITSQVQDVDLDQNIWDKTRNYEPLHSFHRPIEQNSNVNNQYDQKESQMEQFEQNYFSSQSQHDDNSQQIDQPWGVISEKDINTKNQALNQAEQPLPTQISDQTNLDHIPYITENNETQKKSEDFNFGNFESLNLSGNSSSSWNSNSRTESSFATLWDKINSFKDGLSSDDLNTYSNSQEDWTRSNHQDLYHNESSVDYEYNLHKHNFTSYDNLNHTQDNLQNYILNSAKNKTLASTTVTPVSSTTKYQDHPVYTRPLDIGRGDIGPEEFEDNVTGLEVYPLHTKLQTTTLKIEGSTERLSKESQNITQEIEWDHKNESDIHSHVTTNSEATTSKDKDSRQLLELGQATEELDTFNQQLETDDVNQEQTQEFYHEIKYFDNHDQHYSQNTNNSNLQHNNSVNNDNFNQNDDNAWGQDQQSDMVWGQNIDDFLNVYDPQVQQTEMAESFGLNLNKQKEEPRLAEPLKRSSDKQRETELTTTSNARFQQYYERTLTQDPRTISNEPQDIKQVIQDVQTPQVTENTVDIHSIMQQNNTGSQQHLESTNEKSSFWSSVGKKFSSAKDKVVSWFGKS